MNGSILENAEHAYAEYVGEPFFPTPTPFSHKKHLLTRIERSVAERARGNPIRTLGAEDVSTRHQQRLDLLVETDAATGCATDEFVYVSQSLSTGAQL